MSHELQPLQPDDYATPVVQANFARCVYCGLPLSEFYYFCLGCGTPYKDVGTVITPSRPRELTEGELVAIKSPQVWPLFWSFFGVVLFVGVFSELAFTEARIDLLFLLTDAAVFITTCIWGGLYFRSLLVQFKQFGFQKLAAYAGLLGLLPLLAANYGIITLLRSLLDSGKLIDPLEKLRDSGVSEVAIIFTMCVFPAVSEEIAYRGLMQHWLQTVLSPFKAMVLASFLFAVTHFTLLTLPYLFAVGMLLGWTKYKTNSLYPSMVIHFLHNFVVVEFFH